MLQLSPTLNKFEMHADTGPMLRGGSMGLAMKSAAPAASSPALSSPGETMKSTGISLSPASALIREHALAPLCIGRSGVEDNNVGRGHCAEYR